MSRQTNEACLRTQRRGPSRYAPNAGHAASSALLVDEPLGLRFTGHDGARQHYEMWWNGFGVTLEDGTLHWVSEDLVIGDAAFAGRHDGQLAGVAPTGREMRLPFVVS